MEPNHENRKDGTSTDRANIASLRRLGGQFGFSNSLASHLILIVAGLAILSGIAIITMHAQGAPLTVVTNKTGYLAGGSVMITGSGFKPDEVVTLQVTHRQGDPASGVGHDAFYINASANGTFNTTWALSLNPWDTGSNDYVLSATGQLSGAVAPVFFSRIATVQTDKYDYQPGETALITGSGFRPAETETIRIEHANGLTGLGHFPFPVLADSEGRIAFTWIVDADGDSDGAIFRLTATGQETSLTATSAFTDPVLTIIDDGGPDDINSQQKDLNFMQVDNGNLPTALAVNWAWDDTAFSGGNTGDACALFDTNSDGKADNAICVGVGGDPAVRQYTNLWICSNKASDKCTSPSTGPITSGFSSSFTVSTVSADPFSSSPGHTDCNGTNCGTADTVATGTIVLSDFGATTAKLINVCSYESASPTSSPNECVVAPGNGFLTIKKVDAKAGDATAFTFNLGAGQHSQDGSNQWTINGSGEKDLISFAPGTTYNLTEAIPNGWKLTSVSCAIQTSPTTATGTPGATPASGPANVGVTLFEIREGLETICTFTDAKREGSIQIVKNTAGGSAGHNYDFGFTPSGFNANTAFTLTTSGINGSSSSNTFGPLSILGTYSISETSTPVGWELSSHGCTNGTTTSDIDNIVVEDGKTTVCTLTNAENANLSRGKIKIIKATNPSSDTTTQFTFTREDSSTFTLTGGQNNEFGSLLPGSYSVTEGSLTGWSLSDLSCQVTRTANDGQTTTSTKTITNATVSINLNPGDTVTCTYSNSRDQGYLKISKTFDPLTSGFTSNFTITYNCGAGNQTVSLAAGGSTTVGPFDVGTSCTVSEPTLPSAPANWTFGTPSITGSPATITKGDQAAAVGVTVTNSISRDLGSLKITKSVVGGGSGFSGSFGVHVVCTGDSGTYDRTIVYPTPGYVTIDSIPTGNPCTVTETSKANAPSPYSWTTTVITGSPATVTKGGTAEVTVTNTVTGGIKVVKTAVGGDDTFTFTTNFSLPQVKTTGGTGSQEVDNLVPGNGYTITENDLAGWSKGSISCGQGSPSGIVVQAGQTTTCTITNRRNATLTIVKKTVGTEGTFSFTTSGSGFAVSNSFSIGTGTPAANTGSTTFTFTPDKFGEKTVAEPTLGPGWTLDSVVCTSGGTVTNKVATVGLYAGSNVTCTFTNSNIAKSTVTNSSLCTFDVDTGRSGSQFKLTYLMDNNPSIWRLNDSTPGQFYYNLFYTGNGTTDPNNPVKVTITIPYPFVTQGATPLHVYSGVNIIKSGSQTCFIPGAEIQNLKTNIPLIATSLNPAVGAPTTVDVTLPNLSSTGYAYINLHLDYGLKRTSNWSATTDGTGGAINSGLPTTIGNTTVTLPAGLKINFNQAYQFADNVSSGSGQSSGDPTVYSENDFKKVAGFMGQVMDGSSNGIPGIKVVIKDDQSSVQGTVTTDSDGFYLFVYKYTGKGTTWTVTVPTQPASLALPTGVTQAATASKPVKSNSAVLTNFQIDNLGHASVAP